MKCDHGSYIPKGETIAIYCALCNPDGVPDGPVPVLPRSSGDPLQVARSEELATCNCGGVRLTFLETCPECSLPFADAGRGREQQSANAHPAGACPSCGSTIHYETKKKKVWECADCGTEYAAPKKKSAEKEDEHVEA